MAKTGRRIRRSAAVLCGVLLGLPSLGAAATPRPAASPLRAAANTVQGISLVAQVSPPTLGLGSGFVDTATLTPAGGGPAPTGTISFSVYGPTDPACAGPLIFNATNSVAAKPSLSGSFVTPSPGLTPPNVGTYRVVVTYNGDGNYAPVATPCGDPANTVAVGPAPTLTAISPSSGSAFGGNVVTVTGTNLTGAITVNFGSLAAPATVLSSTEVDVTAPAGSGTVNVTVTTQFATTPVVPVGLYTYLSPSAPATPTTPPGLTPVSMSPRPPAAGAVRTTKLTSSTATFTGTVGTSSLTSIAEFQYTVRIPGRKAITRRTSPQTVGLLGRRLTAHVSGLLAKRHYRVRLLLTNLTGTSAGRATTFATH